MLGSACYKLGVGARNEPTPVVSVAELANRLKRAVERTASGKEWVEGEVSGLRRAGSGHVYFTLKDEREEAKLDCVMYRFNANRAARSLQEGARVQLLGKGTVWPPRGRLQLVGERLRPAGRGALLEALEQLKLKLAAEGLFADERKRLLPREPQRVAVVTSPRGAAIHDFCRVAFRRGNVRIVVVPCLVQGEAAPDTILRAIGLAERYPELDVLVVARGGGSGEDLMAFNDERIVRRLAESPVPIVSAVGHETDISLVDLVADVRAATPSEAAELVVPDRAAKLNELKALFRRALRSTWGRVKEDRLALTQLQQQLGDPRLLLNERRQLVDDLEERLHAACRDRLRSDGATLEGLRRRLAQRHPAAVLERSRGQLQPLRLRLGRAGRELATERRAQLTLHEQRLTRATGQSVAQRRELLARHSARLDALSPLKVLRRGYAIALTPEGKALHDAADAPVGSSVELRLARGRLSAQVKRHLEVDE